MITKQPTPRSEFDERGWCVTPEPLFDVDTLAAARAGLEDIRAGRHATGVAPFSDLGHGPGELRKVDQAWWADDRIAAISTAPVLGRIAAELLGVETIHLWHDQLLWKPPGGGAGGVVGWHQDRGYWTAASTSDMVTAWVALDAVSEDMGAMRFVRGSHRFGRVIEGNAFFDTDHDAQRAAAADRLPEGAEWHEEFAPLAAGQATFHHCKTLHGSPPNTSDRPRLGLAVHMISGEAIRVPGKWHANVEFTVVAEGQRWADDPKLPRLWPPV